MKKPVLVVVAPGIHIVARNDIPPGTAYLVDAATITETDEKTGEVKYPLRAVKIIGLT